MSLGKRIVYTASLYPIIERDTGDVCGGGGDNGYFSDELTREVVEGTVKTSPVFLGECLAFLQSRPCLVMLLVLLRLDFLFLESVKRIIRRKVK